eukprot:TRINITY_DN2712_c0_g4_i1.p1 TRINITY_DN2712_c0_g4~~TRINITY_DN2712_c0_g4_i1.p1  ORF type:complete len:412 (-),score=128.67 TRINITY_DN2712_c0_g4_i1:1076-2290(-)
MADTVKLRIRNAITSVELLLTVPVESTILDVKKLLAEQFEGKPQVLEQRLIFSGRVPEDREILREVFAAVPQLQADVLTMMLVIRPGGMSPAQPLRPVQQLQQPAPQAVVAGPAAAQYFPNQFAQQPQPGMFPNMMFGMPGAQLHPLAGQQQAVPLAAMQPGQFQPLNLQHLSPEQMQQLQQQLLMMQQLQQQQLLQMQQYAALQQQQQQQGQQQFMQMPMMAGQMNPAGQVVGVPVPAPPPPQPARNNGNDLRLFAKLCFFVMIFMQEGSVTRFAVLLVIAFFIFLTQSGRLRFRVIRPPQFVRFGPAAVQPVAPPAQPAQPAVPAQQADQPAAAPAGTDISQAATPAAATESHAAPPPVQLPPPQANIIVRGVREVLQVCFEFGFSMLPWFDRRAGHHAHQD